MPLDPAELRRGTIVYAVFPFAADFPARINHDGSWIDVESVEQFAKLRTGRPTGLIAEVRLRPVLLLHDGTRGEHDDVVCLRINTVKPRHRGDKPSWRKITNREHPLFFHLPRSDRYGLPDESVIALPSIGAINKSAIVSLRPRGRLSADEMQIISERLRTALSLDLSPQIAAQARELLRRAGVLSNQSAEQSPGG